MKRIVIVVAVVVALGLGYVLGVAHAVRTWRAAQTAVVEGPQPKGIPINPVACDVCLEYFPEWWCWIGGCL